MIRIAVERQSVQEAVLKIDGDLSGAHVEVLVKEGGYWLERVQHLVLDLAEVKFIDEVGLSLLEEWAGPKLEIRRAPRFIAALLAQRGFQESPNHR